MIMKTTLRKVYHSSQGRRLWRSDSVSGRTIEEEICNDLTKIKFEDYDGWVLCSKFDITCGF